MVDPRFLLPANCLAVTELDDERLLYDADAGVIHLLNAPASLIWSLCDGRHGVAEMSAALRRRFAVPAGCDLDGQVCQTLAELVDRNVLAAPG